MCSVCRILQHRRYYVEIKCQLNATEVFSCRSYCLLNMFRAPLCTSSGGQEYYRVFFACVILCCGFSSSCSGVELRFMCPVCRMLQHRRQYVEIKCQLDATGVFYCISYCLLNIFRAPLCPSSGAQEYYTVFVPCGTWCCGFQVADLVVELRVMCPACRMLQHRRQYAEIKCQLDVTEGFFLQILLHAQHVSGTTMHVIRSSSV